MFKIVSKHSNKRAFTVGSSKEIKTSQLWSKFNPTQSIVLIMDLINSRNLYNKKKKKKIQKLRSYLVADNFAVIGAI